MKPVLVSFLILTFVASHVNTQQTYSGNAVLACNSTDEAGPSSNFLYTCNGQNRSCRAFLIFKSQPPYDSVPTISTLTSTNQEELAKINNVTRLTVFPVNKEVIIPVSCSCSGLYYWARTVFDVTDIHSTYFTIANNTYQGLSTCDSLKHVNPTNELELGNPHELQVPLRCACPTRNQTVKGIKYLLTYSINWNDTIQGMGQRFNATAEAILRANGFRSEDNPTIFPFTTILIPLNTEPTSSETVIQYQQPTISPPPASIHPSKSFKKKIYMGFGIATCSFLLLAGSITFFILYKQKKTAVPCFRGEGKKGNVLQADLRVEIASLEETLKVFKYEELKKATRNFSSRNKIQGSVYRGELRKEILAVKKMNTDISMEVNILKNINHFNLIQLKGFCEVSSSSYLVFEYMSNGSLKEWLCGKNSKKLHSWRERIQIALDVAHGLHYLHSFTKPAYVHKDITSSSILLNGDLRAKITNFSLARATRRETSSSCVVTIHVGSRGYTPPEYIEAGTAAVTPKIDIYAFGVLVLELITGKNAVFLQEGHEVLLSEEVSSIMESENAESELHCILDPRLQSCRNKLGLQMVRLGLSCLENEPARRPGMGEIVSTLLKIQANLQNP